MTTRLRMLTIAGSVTLVLVAAVAALAFLTANGVGSGSPFVGTLGSPSPVIASTSTPGIAQVDWSIVASPSGTSTDVTYVVDRSGNAGLNWVSANNSCAGSLSRTTLTCNDQPGADGDYLYRVTARFRTAWTSVATSNSVQLVTDSTSPTRTSMIMNDVNANGLVDQVVVTFSETLASYTAGNAPWTLANVPSGGSLSSVSVAGTTATLTLNEGAGSANTAVGSFTVALAANAAGIRDAAGNQSSFAATAPTDGAAPRRCAGGCGAAMVMQDVNGNGTVDQVVATFSETLATYTAGTAPWTLANVPSGRSLASVAVSSATVTLSLTATPATLDTAVGSFTVALAADAGGIRDAAGNLTSFAAAAPADQAAPVRTSLVMKDVNANGKVDQVVATYTENVVCTCSGTAGWTLTNIPSTGTFASVAANTNQITITINEGAGAANTAVGTFTVAYASGAGRVTDAAPTPNPAVTIAAAPPTDEAKPIPIGLTIANGGGSNTAGTIEKDDTISIVFSEILKVSSICSAWTSGDTSNQALAGGLQVTASIIDNGATSGNDQLKIALPACTTNAKFGSIDLGSSSFVNSTMTFTTGSGGNQTVFTWTAASRMLQLELGTATGGGTLGNVGSVTATYTPAPEILDSPGNGITGAASKAAVQF